MALDRLWESMRRTRVPMAITIGRCIPNSATHGLTIVPGEFELSLDVRAYDEASSPSLDREASRIIADIEQGRGRIELRSRAEARAVVARRSR